MAGLKKLYMTTAEKESIRKSYFSLKRKLKTRIEKLGAGYDRDYLKDALKELDKSYKTFSNIW